MDIRIKLGLRIREIRLKKHLSQEALAHLCNLDRTYISRIEKGQPNISLIVIERLAIGLNVSLVELFENL